MCDLKCIKCDNELSVSPIKYFNGHFYCGRCLCPEGTIVTIYEELAKRSGMQFPCKYKTNGCTELLPFSKVKEHEEICRNKLIYCPINNCSHQILLCKADLHVEKFHSDKYISSTFEIDLREESGVSQKIFKYNEYLFLVTLINGPDDLVMNLKYLCSNRSKFKKYKTTFKSKNLQKDFSVWVKEITTCENREESCDFVANQEMLKFLTESASSKILVEISFEAKSELQENVQKSLECPICNNFLQEPIMQCSSGHSFCKNCTEMMRKCPFCRESFSNRLTRNFALESISREIISPCRNAALGCDFIGMPNEVRQHSKICDLIECPVKNDQECFVPLHFHEVYEHCKKEHNIKTNPLKHVHVDLSKNAEKPSVRVIEAYGKIFKFYRVFNENCFKYLMMYVGPEHEANMYVFNFELVNKCEQKTLKFRENIKPFKTEKYINPEDCLNIPKEGFTEYLDKGCLYCNVSIDLKSSTNAADLKY